MPGFLRLLLTVTQVATAGMVIGLCALHGPWWRDGRRGADAAWTVAWSLALAGVCMANGLLTAASESWAAPGLLLVRFVALSLAVVLSFPAMAVYASGPRARVLMVVSGAWYATVAVLWVSTDLVFAHRVTGGLPVYGPLAPALSLLPLVGVGAYLVRAVRSRPVDRAGVVLTVTGTLSAALLVVAFVPPVSIVSELLQGVWVLPLGIGLHVVASSRIATLQRDADRRAAMRDALASLANAALFIKEPERILAQATASGRQLVGDPSIDGTVRPLGRNRFVTELYSVEGRPMDQDDTVFLRDLARVVSGAAERQALTARLGRAAFTDSLTQLLNRHALDRSLAEALEKANVERTRVAVLFCDLDGFKQANDRHGHEWGDTLLVRTAEHLRDVVGDGPLIARHGGDEFVVVVPRAASLARLRVVAERIRHEFTPPGQDAIPVSITVGVAAWHPGEPVEPSALVRDADLAMLEAKRLRSGVAVYDGALRARVTAQSTLRRDLQRGVAAGELVAHFQPVTDTSTLEVVGLEVLARWNRDGRLVEPADWLPFAEESTLIEEVGRQMFQAARAGMERFGLPVAVNVAARQLDARDFVDQVVAAWGDSDWDRLTIEVTESALLHDADHVRRALVALADRGVTIALDDFGTGYNSLSRLAELPLHVLKIDRAFVRGIGTAQGAAVLRAILTLAEAHGLEVIAEGVERVDELTALVAMGVTTAQGNMLGRPAATLPLPGRTPCLPQWRIPRPRTLTPAGSA
ncbi:MAG TPA: EAL domain-containing protein [Actinotalea sp.]